MKKRISRLEKVLAVAKAEERNAVDRMNASIRKLQAGDRQVSELNAFRHEYGRQVGGHGYVNASRWQDFQRFRHRLDQALNAQTDLNISESRNRELHQKRWLEKKQKVESLEKVIDRYVAAARQRRNREEQKALDDLACNRGTSVGCNALKRGR